MPETMTTKIAPAELPNQLVRNGLEPSVEYHVHLNPVQQGFNYVSVDLEAQPR